MVAVAGDCVRVRLKVPLKYQFGRCAIVLHSAEAQGLIWFCPRNQIAQSRQPVDRYVCDSAVSQGKSRVLDQFAEVVKLVTLANRAAVAGYQANLYALSAHDAGALGASSRDAYVTILYHL